MKRWRATDLVWYQSAERGAQRQPGVVLSTTFMRVYVRLLQPDGSNSVRLLSPHRLTPRGDHETWKEYRHDR